MDGRDIVNVTSEGAPTLDDSADSVFQEAENQLQLFPAAYEQPRNS